MMKYIFCILFGSLLMLGFHYTPDEKVQEAQSNAGVVAMDVQSDTRLAQKISVTVAGHHMEEVTLSIAKHPIIQLVTGC